MPNINVNIHLDGELVSEYMIGELNETVEETVEYEFDIVEEEEEKKSYERYPQGIEFINSSNKKIWVRCFNGPPGYCEECGTQIENPYNYYDIDQNENDFHVFRGEVWDKRIADDPILRPFYEFCSEQCKNRFIAYSHAERYSDKDRYCIEFDLSYEAYDRFARVLVNGTEVYTLDGFEFEHHPGDFPKLTIRFPFGNYCLSGSPMGPENHS